MATTPGGIWFPSAGDPITPIESVFQTLANSVDAAQGVPLFATTTARDTQFALKAFGVCMVGSTVDTAVWYYRDTGAWYLVDPSLWGQNSWQTYTPTWTASTTSPTGYTINLARFQLIGKTCFVKLMATIGASVGTGVYSFSLPATPATAYLTGSNMGADGQGWIRDVSAAVTYPITPQVLSSTVTIRMTGVGATAGAQASNTVPMTWATTDYIELGFQYETA
jgi:hypothetical protein